MMISSFVSLSIHATSNGALAWADHAHRHRACVTCTVFGWLRSRFRLMKAWRSHRRVDGVRRIDIGPRRSGARTKAGRLLTWSTGLGHGFRCAQLLRDLTADFAPLVGGGVNVDIPA